MGNPVRYNRPTHRHIGRFVPPKHPPEKMGASHTSLCQGSRVTKSSHVLSNSHAQLGTPAGLTQPQPLRRSLDGLGFEKEDKGVWQDPFSLPPATSQVWASLTSSLWKGSGQRCPGEGQGAGAHTAGPTPPAQRQRGDSTSKSEGGGARRASGM